MIKLTRMAGIGCLLLGCLSLAAIGPAAAHARLKSAQPAAGSTVKTAPSAITLEFGESVVPKFSGIALSDAAGKPLALGTPASGQGAASLVAPVESKLAPGTYTVTWHAVSVDTHRTQGSFRFTVAP